MSAGERTVGLVRGQRTLVSFNGENDYVALPYVRADWADAQIAALTAEREALREALELCATLAYCGGTSYEELEPVRSALALAQPVKP